MATVKKPRDPKSVGSTKSRVIHIPAASQSQPQPQAKWRPVDWNKVKTLHDVKMILSNMGLGCSEDAPLFSELEKYLVND
jgi:hypothetical protein